MYLFLALQLFVALLVILASIGGLIILGLTKSNAIKSCLVTLWGFILFVVVLSLIIRFFTTKTVLDRSDFYGKYVIDTSYFDPVQAQWQYDHFRFEIKRNDSIYFYVTDKERIIKTYKGTIETPIRYESARLKFNMESPSHYILETPPTIYRGIWDFKLVFRSKKYHNMYFVKE